MGSPLVFKIFRRPLPLETGAPPNLQRAKKGQRLWLGDEEARKQGEAMLNRVGPMYGVKYSWDSRCSSAFDSLRLVLWAQSQGKNEEFMAAIGWRHFGEDKQLADRQELLAAAEEAGLDRQQAEQVIDRGRFQRELAETTNHWLAKTMVDAGGGMMVSGIPVLIFKSTNPRQKTEDKLHGSIPQHDIEAALRRLEALEKNVLGR